MQKLQQLKHLERSAEIAAISSDAWFFENIETASGECWEWLGKFDHRGYGVTSAKRLGSGKAHRVAYTMAFGPIKKGNVVCHLCDNRWCVRPMHLVQATQARNVEDAWAKGRGKNPSLRGSKNPMSKFSDATINMVIELRLSGMKLKNIHEITGVSEPHISAVVRGKFRNGS